MSRPATIIVFVLFLFGAAYAGSPYWAVRQFRYAALSADADRLDAVVDFAAVRESLKAQLNAAMAAKMNNDPSTKSNPFAGLGMMLIPTMVDKMVEAIVTPEGVSALVKRGEINRPGSSPPTLSEDVNVDQYYIGLDRFRVTLRKKDGTDDPVTLAFERRGLFTWKLTRIQLPDTLFRDKQASVGAPAAADRPLPSADPLPPEPTAPSEPMTTMSLGTDTVDFASYPGTPLNGSFMVPDFDADPSHADYRTLLRKTAAQGVNFAGHFAVTSFGCGTFCHFYMVLDGNTGRTTDFPMGGEDYPSLDLEYNAQSSLIKAYWTPDQTELSVCEHADFVQEGNGFRRLDGDGKRVACPS